MPRLANLPTTVRIRKGLLSNKATKQKSPANKAAKKKEEWQKGPASKAATQWLESKAKEIDRHIHHHSCGHGGERWIEGSPVDGYEPKIKTVFQYHGCYWHGCPAHCKRGNAPDLYTKTKKRDKQIRDAGFNLVVTWECEQPRDDSEPQPLPQTVIYPHAIAYDFEALIDKTKAQQPTPDLSFENTHVPTSVSIGDSLDLEPTHICERDPKRLINAFVDEVMRRATAIQQAVRQQFLPEDGDLLPEKQRNLISEWCDQVPVLGFNSGKYDMNLIKKHFVEKLATFLKRSWSREKEPTQCS